MADRCVFFEELLRASRARQRSYVVAEPPGAGLACLDARLRVGADWLFARRWVSTRGTHRTLYRWLDRLEASGFRFRVDVGRVSSPLPDGAALPRGDARASTLLGELSREERDLHRELFPDESDLLAKGYDWDARGVYRGGVRLRADGFGRILDVEGDVLYEWVPVADEFTWRRFPLERVRVEVTRPGT